MSTVDRSVITIDYTENLLSLDTRWDRDHNERQRQWERTGQLEVTKKSRVAAGEKVLRDGVGRTG